MQDTESDQREKDHSSSPVEGITAWPELHLTCFMCLSLKEQIICFAKLFALYEKKIIRN